MDSTGMRDHLIGSVIEHCLAFKDHIKPFEKKQYATQYPPQLLRFLQAVNEAVIARLQDLGSRPDFKYLEEEEAEQHILRYSQLYSYLYMAASLVERGDVAHVVVELVQPLKRLMRRELKGFELILYPMPALNYNFYPLGNVLWQVITELGFAELLERLPRQLIAIGFPGLEIERFLVHCVIAHELGHCLYVEHKLESRLLPLVKPDERRVEDIVKDLAQARVEAGFDIERAVAMQHTLSEYFSELEIRRFLTTQITDISKRWVKELTCDAIAYCLFGPAYLFSVLSFLTTAVLFDDDRGTHPPNRMRLLLLYKLLDMEKPEGKEVVTPEVDIILESWRSATLSREPRFTDPIRSLAGTAIMGIYQDIIDTAISAVGAIGAYSVSEHAVQLKKLMERVKLLVPPNELIENGAAQDVSFQSIINAGWLAYISHAQALAEKYQWDPWECKGRLNGLIAKAVEINEIQRRWSEVK